MSPPRVLLIDDEVHFTSNISKMLSARGYHVETAASGEEGLEILKHSTFDVVVLDLRMPGISGLDVLKKVNKVGWDAPEFIILTGFASVDSAIAGLNSGAYDYITKPVPIKELTEKIAAACKRKLLRQEGTAPPQS